MAIDPPYRLDPLQNPVNVKWGGEEFLSFVLPIIHSPTIEFQRTRFVRQNMNYSVNAQSGDAAIGNNFWPTYATDFHWIFADQSIVLQGWNGSSWAVCQFNNPPQVISGGVISGSSGIKAAATPSIIKITGLPTLPSSINSAPADSVAGAFGTAPRQFFPQAEWIAPSGGQITSVVNGVTKPVRLQIGTATFSNYVSCSSVRIQMRGIAETGSAFVLPRGSFPTPAEEIEAFQTEMDVGFVPQGGPAMDDPTLVFNPSIPTATFGDFTIDVSGITAKRGTQVWKGVGAALYQPLPVSFAFARFAGAMYVLLRLQHTP